MDKIDFTEDYLSEMSIKEIMYKYDFNSYIELRKYVKELGLKFRNLRWTKEQIEKLKQIYKDADWNLLLTEFFPFDKEAITKKASEQKIKRKSNIYTAEEMQTLKNNKHLPTAELAALLPSNRSTSAIDCKLNKEKIVRRAKWTTEEINILYQYYENYSNDYIHQHHLTHRSVTATQNEADKLGLSKNKKFIANLNKIRKQDIALQELKDFANKLGRTPTSREILANKSITSISSYNRYFGSYNKACEEAGLTPNLSLFGESNQVYYSLNDDICFSKSEKELTDIFIKSGVSYVKEVHYKNIINSDTSVGEKRCDWLINDSVVVEFFGMPEKIEYAKRMKEKFELCKKHNIPLIDIYRKDIDRVNKHNLKKKFKTYGIKLIC